MQELSAKQISEQHMDLQEFKYCYHEYKKDTKFRDVFNKLFSADIKQAFVATSAPNVSVDKTGIDWCGSYILIVNAKGKVVQLSNSEWANFSFQ